MPFIAGCSKYALGTWAKNNVPTDSLRTSLATNENPVFSPNDVRSVTKSVAN